MDILIKTPTHAISTNVSPDEFIVLKKKASYTNTSIMFQLSKVKKMNWFKDKNPVAWEERCKELEKQLKGCVIKFDNGVCSFHPGFIPYMKTIVNIVKIESEVNYPTAKDYEWKKEIPFELYGYQKEVIKRLIDTKHGHVSLCTGSGKTICILSIVKELGLKALVVTPSKSIFTSIYDDFREHLGKDLVGAYGDGKKDLKKPITIAIGKSLTMIKPDSEAFYFFKDKEVVCFDESHVLPSATLEKVNHGVLKNVPYRFFFSGTQTRGDGQIPVLQGIIGECVYDLGIKEAIEGKYLCPLKFNVITTVSPNNKTFRDPIECKRNHFLYNGNIAKIYAQIINSVVKNKNNSVLVMVEELIQIKMLTNLLEVPYTYIHSASKKDAAKYGLDKIKLKDELERFNKGEVKVLIGTKAIAIGTNIYPTHIVLNWSGGSSEIATKQGTMGRSTRKLENSKYKDFHNPKLYSKIIDVNVANVKMLKKPLEKRIKFYEETGEKVDINEKLWPL